MLSSRTIDGDAGRHQKPHLTAEFDNTRTDVAKRSQSLIVPASSIQANFAGTIMSEDGLGRLERLLAGENQR